jgi:hypothetical protein
MSGDQSRSTVAFAKFTIDKNSKTERVPNHNGDRCSVKETNLNCDAVLTLLDKKKSVNDETLFSLSINNYDNRINDEMKKSLEKNYNVIYYNSQFKKFYSSYENDDDKETVNKNISHILILGKTDTLFISEGIYTFTIDKTILIYENDHVDITSVKESTPILTMYEYFNLIYIDWFSLLLTDFEKEFKKAYPDDPEYENDFESDSSTGGGTPRTTTDDIPEEEGLINQIRINQIDENAATKLQAAARAKLAANKEEKIAKNIKEFNAKEPDRRKFIIERQDIIGEKGGVADNRNRIISVSDIDGDKKSKSLLGGKKKGKKTKKLN